MNNTTTLHIPMDRTVRDQLEKKAKKLGFDSAQAYIRVWAKAEADNRCLDFDDWGKPSPKAAARLKRIGAEARRLSRAGMLPSARSVDELMAQLQSK